MITTDETVGLAEWINDDTCLFLPILKLYSPVFKLRQELFKNKQFQSQ